MTKNFTSNNPATVFISSAKENMKQTNQKQEKVSQKILVKWTVYYDKDKKKKLEEIAFYEEKHIYEVIDEAITDFLNKRK